MESLADTGAIALLGGAFYAVSSAVPSPFMDEVFHVPQTQQYCAGNWGHWDSKITTPPGLYLIGYIFGKLGGCDTMSLRASNLVGLVAGAWVVARLYKRSVFSYLLSFPFLSFYSLLYYTDVWATMAVLVGLGLTLRHQYVASSVVFALSLLFRQTNIVWAGYAAVCALSEVDLAFLAKKTHSGPHMAWTQMSLAASNLLKPRISLPFVGVAAIFAAFLGWNGGIALGDKSNHELSINLAQIPWFCLFSAGLSWPLILADGGWLRGYLSQLRGLRLAVYLVELVAIHIVVTRFSVVHPFVLADNRHYTFYLWRRVLYRSDGLSVAILPVYHAAISWMSCPPVSLHVIFWWLALAAVLVPSPLLEPRYYIVGYLIWRLVVCDRRISRWEVFWNSVVSFATIYVFCESDTHFMW